MTRTATAARAGKPARRPLSTGARPRPHIRAGVTIDGQGRYDVSTGIRFFDHMLDLFARHGGFDLTLTRQGDLDVDQHHTVEDVGIVLGEAVLKALGDRKGINRAGYFVMPMDETLAVVAIDLGGRPHASVDLKVKVRDGRRPAGRTGARLLRGLRHAARAPTCTRRCSTAARATTTSKRCSRRSRGRCACACADERLAKMLLPSTKGCSAGAAGSRSSTHGAGNLDVGAQGAGNDAVKGVTTFEIHRREPAECLNADGLIVPGVGHFAATARARCGRGATRSLEAVRRGTPLLGICVGMQWLFEGERRGARRAAGWACCRGQIATARRQRGGSA